MNILAMVCKIAQTAMAELPAIAAKLAQLEEELTQHLAKEEARGSWETPFPRRGRR
jgi:iron-sulfur cluster repair protein YtfE (RIC family)